MSFWKQHRTLRGVLMGVFFLLGVSLSLYGWTLTGLLAGLGWMSGGILCLLIALLLYNKGF